MKLKTENLTLLALTLLALNYLIINLSQLDNSVLIYGRGLVVILLVISFSTSFSIQRTNFYLLLISFGAVLVGFPSNNIALNIFFLLFFVTCSKNVEFDLIVNCCLIVLASSLVLTFTLLLLGVVENTLDIVDGRERATFGFANTNAFSSLVYSFIVLCLYKFRWNTAFKYVTCYGLTYVAFRYTDNKTLLASVLIFTLAHLLIRFSKPGGRINFITSFLLLVPIAFTQLSSYILAKFPLADILLSSRLTLSSYLMKEMSWGNYIYGGLSPSKTITVDNSLLLIQASVGTPFLIILVWLTYQKLKDCINKRHPETYALILSIWYFSFSESSIVRPEAIIGLVFWLLICRTEGHSRSRTLAGSNENSLT